MELIDKRVFVLKGRKSKILVEANENITNLAMSSDADNLKQ